MAYSKKVIDKFENTINEPHKHSVGRWDPKEEDVGTGMVGAPACGDVMRLQIKCKVQIHRFLAHFFLCTFMPFLSVFGGFFRDNFA